MKIQEVALRAISDLRPREGNPRTHSKKQLEQLGRSIAKFGFTNPVLIDDEDGIIAGHGRIEAAKMLGITEVPAIRLSNMSEADVRAYVIADNKLAENAGWDRNLLRVEFQYLAELEFDFDLTVTGFDLPEIDVLIADGPETLDAEDVIPPLSEELPVTRPGDIWQIGPHRLICGDATISETYDRLLEGEKATMAFTDPPYNVPIDGHVCGLGKVKHREFAMASGEMSPEQFTSFLFKTFNQLARASIDGALHFHCMDWRHLKEIMDAGDMAYSELKNLCVWAKTNGGMGSLYRSAHELVLLFKVGRGAHVNNVELGRHGRYRTNVWTYPGANTFSATRDQDLASHPTVKPVAMVADAMLDCSRRKDIVIDAFAGSGTTLVAAQRTGRRGYGIEIDPAYCDLIVRRLEALSKHKGALVGDGRTFGDIAAEHALQSREEVTA